MDFAELADQAWETTVDVAADWVEVFARAKASACADECEYDPCETPKRKSDFLYDLVHLNVNYWMQMARLGSAYSIYAHRAMGALYGLYAAPRGRKRSNELVYAGVPGNTQTQVLKFTNQSDAEATPVLELTPLRCEDEEPKFDYRFIPKEPAIKAGGTGKVGLEITIPKASSGTYRGTLKVELGGRKKAFRVVVRISDV